jgi:hypothetical protein
MWYHSGTTQGVVVMSERSEQVKAYVTPAEKQQLKEWAEETDQSLSSLVRQAVLEYTDKDRTARVEDKLDRVLDTLDAGDTHTQTYSGGADTQGSQTVERTREIADRLYDNHGTIIDDSDVDRAVTDIAGGDPRTVEKYKDELRDRSLLYQHPNDDLERWYTEREMWLSDVVDYTRQFSSPLAKLTAILQQYDLSVTDVRHENSAVDDLIVNQ